MYCRPAFQHLHSLANGPLVEQVECRVQLQHRSTVSQTRLLDGGLTVEHIPNSSVRVSSFRFCPPDEPAAVKQPDTLSAIARPSLLRSEVSAGTYRWDLTLLAHSRRPLARRRPHRHYTMVCLWDMRLFDCYLYSTLFPDAGVLCLPKPFAFPAIC